jgi:glutamate synthase (NADPH/NADH) small chain
VLRTSSSHQEGGTRRWNIDTLEFLPDADNSEQLGGLSCVAVEWLTENGRLLKPVAQKDSGFRQEADMALLALGFSGAEETPLLKALAITPDQSGRLPRDSSGRLGAKLYACGDAALGASLVVRAIADGLMVARTILSDCQT